MQYRRIHISPGDIVDQTRGYLPIKRDEFRRRLGHVRDQFDAADRQQVRIREAQYHARLDTDQLVEGTATLQLAAAGNRPARLVLRNLGLAIRNPRWPSAKRPGQLGLSPQGEWIALVGDATSLAFDWSLAGERQADGSVRFVINLPRCTISQLWLDVPEGLGVHSNHGLVCRTPVAGHGPSQSSRSSRSTGSVMSGDASKTERWHRWRIDLGGRPTATIDIVPESSAGDQRRIVLYRESSTLTLSERGLVLSADLALQGHSLRQAILELDAGIELTAAMSGEQHLQWTVLPGDGAGKTRVALPLPLDFPGDQRLVRLTAMAPLSIGRTWTLPDIHPVGLFWQEATMTLRVRRSLELQQLLVQGGRQSRVEPLPAPQDGESIQIQYFAADHHCQVRLATTSSRIETHSYTGISLTGSSATASMAVDVSAKRGERFRIEAGIQSPWVLESVQSQPAEVMSEWNVEREASGKERLVVQLREPLRPYFDVRLLLQARCPLTEESEPLGPDQLVPVQLRDTLSATRMVGVRAEAPYALDITDDCELTRRDDEELDSQLDSGLEPGGWDVVFMLDRGARATRFALRRDQPRYRADIQVEATWDGQALIESTTIDCRPVASRVSRVIVHFTHSSPAPVAWTMDQPEAEPVLARALGDQERRSLKLPSGQTWEICLPQPRGDAFSLRARRQTLASAPPPVALVTVPQATSQRGQLTIRSGRGAAIAVGDNPRLTAIPAPVTPPDRMAATRGVYRYQPSELLPSDRRMLTIALRDETNRQPAAWAWLCLCQSQYATGGTAIHQVRYRLENTGLEHIAIQMPDRCQLQRLMVDGVDTPIAASKSLDTPLIAALPAGIRFPVVTVQFATPRQPLAIVDHVGIQLPDIGLPVLNRRWTVWLPPPYAVWESDQCMPGQSPLSLTWSRRLFGRLGGRTQRPFDLFDPDQWRDFLQTMSAPGANAPAAGETSGLAVTGAPWPLPTHADQTASAPPSRPTWTVQWAGVGHARLGVYRRATLCYCGWAAFLMVVAACWCAAVYRVLPRPALLLLAAVSGTLTQWLTPPWVPVAAGVFWGTAVFALLRLVTPRAALIPAPAPHPPIEASPHSTTATFVGGAPSILLVLSLVPGLIGWTGTAVAAGQKNGAPPAAPPATIEYQVLDPVDDQGKPAVDYVFVPEAFYDLLHQPNETAQPVAWLIRSAQYQATLVWDAEAADYGVPELTAVYDVRVRAAASRIRLPLHQRDVLVLPDNIRLDGRPVTGNWTEDGLSLVVEFDQPGDYQLELTLRPLTRPVGDAHGFQIAIPAVASSRFQMQLPLQLPEVHVNRAYGQTVINRADRVLRTELGPTNQLAVRWTSQKAARDVDSRVDVEQLVWITVRPGAVVLDAQIRLQVLQGLMRRVVLVTDPRLRWLPLPKRQPFSNVSISRGDVQTIELELADGVEDQTTLWARLVLADTSGVGNLRLPRLEVRGARSTSKWMAVSIDPSLEYEETIDSEGPPPSVREFVDAWGESARVPDLAYALPAGRFAWSLTTHLRQPETTGSQMMSLYFDSSSTEVQLIADLSTTDGYLYQHRIAAPRELVVESVQVTSPDGGADAVKRWSRDESGRVHVFLVRPVSGRHRLVLRGKLPTLLSREVPLPWLAVEDVDILLTRISLYRYRDVLVDMVSQSGLTRLSDQSSGENVSVIPPEQLFRSVAAYDCAGAGKVAATLKVSSNQPRIRAKVVMRLLREKGTWWSDLDCRLQVDSGQLDVLHFDAPATWGGRLALDPSVRYRWVDFPQGDRRHLVVLPRQSLQGDVRLHLRGCSASTAIDAFRVPNIVPLNVEVTQWIVILPTEVDQQPISWKTSQLVPVPVPRELAGPPSASLVAYRVAGRDYGALAHPRKVVSETPTISLADIRLVLLGNRQCYGVASFQLQPAGRSHVVCELPENCQLVEVRVGGLPATPVRRGPRTWRVSLSSDWLPQPIDMVYRGQLVTGHAPTVHFPAPSIQGITARQCLWALCSEANPRSSWIMVNDRRIDRCEHAAAAYEATSELVIRTCDRLGEEPTGDLTRWYVPWARILDTYRRHLDSCLAESDRQGQSPKARKWARLRQQLTAIDARMQGPSPSDTPDAGRPASDAHRPLTTAPFAATYFASPGPDVQGPLMSVRSAAGSSLKRLAAGCGLLLAVAGIGWLSACRSRRYWAAQWWPLFGIGVGLFWWLWLQPSVAGWLIVAACLYAALRTNPVLSRKGSA